MTSVTGSEDTKTEKTEVGSVFVSNYPAYFYWGEEQVPAVTEALNKPAPADTPMGLYIHIPFCRKRCKFCYFKVYTGKNSAEIQRYLDAVATEAHRLAKYPAVAGRPLRFVYFGGGTPSYLSAKQLTGLVENIKKEWSWDNLEEVTFECEPGTLTRPKLEGIRSIGVTRLSLGVENFHDHILEENGRAHLSGEIYRVTPWIKELQFDQFNIDLIAGMVGETWDTWKENIDRTIALEPDSVTIYQMELPFNTVYSRGILDGGDIPVADWKTKRAWNNYAMDTLAGAGYELSSAYTMVRKDKVGKFAYRDSLWHGSDMVGIGVSSFSHLGGVHYQNLPTIETYTEAVEKGEMPFSRAFATGAGERLIRELILQMKLGRLSASYFQNKFQVNIIEKYNSVFKELAEDGFLTYDNDGVTLTRSGLLRVDGLLPNFYDEKYMGTRYT